MSATIRASRSPLRRPVAGGPGRAARSRRRTRPAGRPGSRTSRGGSRTARGSGTPPAPMASTRTAVIDQRDLGDVRDERRPSRSGRPTSPSARRSSRRPGTRAARRPRSSGGARGQEPEQAAERRHAPASVGVVAPPRAAGGTARRVGQVRRRAGLDDPPAVEDDDLVGDRHEPQPVRHDEHGPVAAASRPTASRMTVSLAASSCEVASSRMTSRASARNARAIAIRWRCPPLSRSPSSPTGVVVAVRQRGDERVRARPRGRPRGPPSSVGVGPGEPDVVGDRAVEQVRPLRDPGDVRPPGREVDRARAACRRPGSRRRRAR